ncbi:MAG TPA: nucleoside transporter C-terminal domain-containing protein [Leptospiraceae bacterium]|nr:nucleoside transporter C-terminal domain-containing protein [Leptospiraceae bacterium]HMW05118.1 nucleoside transporter C-terminal domain-containing protein [Leptospiraceae bacterium]HMX31372.1 nucleoside transporter C-terminal domain-containing protein [Leptospiraceae bacterium]HMY31585.1 nucleoside transporter C-terminal domain-containing protein [Leptospiraceae bacterium]HMZ66852.1 nucleoside transporter C-terminal domain-containing protein [Leptospiraceae bacterium]
MIDIRLNIISLVGMYVLCIVAWLSSENRKLIPWNVIKWGIGIQFVMGFFIFVFPITRSGVEIFGNAINFLLEASEAGARFLFSGVFVPPVDKVMVKPTDLINPQTGIVDYSYIVNPKTGFFERSRLDVGFIFAFRSLPQVIFFSAIITLLYRMNAIQPVVNFFAKIFQRTLGTSGAESLSGAANIFVGIESVVAVKPFLLNMTRSELCAILASCFGSISSTVLGMYAGFLRPTFPTITGHLMAASFLTIPACFVISKIIIPESGMPETMGGVPEDKEDPNEKKPSYMDSLILGALDGVKMAVGIAAVIIAILGCVALVNMLFAWLASFQNNENTLLQFIGRVFKVVSLDNIFGLIFLPLTFFTGVSLDMNELWQSSVLIGQRLLQTSIPPYVKLGELSRAGEISDRAMLIVSYVLCGFAHIPSIGIFVGGLSNLVPSRSGEISSIAWKAMWAATLATLMTGCVAGIFDFGSPDVIGMKPK